MFPPTPPDREAQLEHSRSQVILPPLRPQNLPVGYNIPQNFQQGVTIQSPFTRQPLDNISPTSNLVNRGSLKAPAGKPVKSMTPNLQDNAIALGNKRQYEDISSDEEIDDEDDEEIIVTDSCDQVRRKINNFINNGGMKVTAFQKAIGTNSRSYGAFMKQKGPRAGSGSNVYFQAFRFFKKREDKGVAMPHKKVKVSEAAKLYDIGAIHLDGEEDESVEVYDTCDDVRRKISAHLREPHVTQAKFLREAASMFPSGRKLVAKQLNDFLGQNGPSAGNTSGVYYGAYVLLEKMRIKAGKPKSKKRIEMEKIWASEGGMDRVIPISRGYICSNDTRPFTDQYGRVTIQKIR